MRGHKITTEKSEQLFKSGASMSTISRRRISSLFVYDKVKAVSGMDTPHILINTRVHMTRMVEPIINIRL